MGERRGGFPTSEPHDGEVTGQSVSWIARHRNPNPIAGPGSGDTISTHWQKLRMMSPESLSSKPKGTLQRCQVITII